MSIQNALNAAIYSRLTGGTALTGLLSGTTSVYFKSVPEGNTDSDFVIFDYGSDLELNIAPGRERDELLLIKGVSKNNPSKAGSIENQIDALIHDQTLTVAGWTNFWIRRETGVSLEEDDDGDRWYHSGAYFRILLDQD